MSTPDSGTQDYSSPIGPTQSGAAQGSVLPDNTGQNFMGLASVVKMLGGVSGGISQINSYASKASAENFNAAVEGQNASNIAAATASNVAALRLSNQQKIGQQRANLAAAGIGPISQGSAGESINTSEVNANLQALMEQYRGNVARTNALNSQSLDQYYAKVAKSNETTAKINTGMGALSQLLEGYGNYTKGGF